MTKTIEEDFRKHIEGRHRKFSVAGYLKEIVYGGSDGIITTFAVVAGFAGAQSQAVSQYPVVIVLIFGFANLLADAFSMGVGNVLSVLSDKDVYKTERDKELYEIKNNPEFEKKETIYILKKKGFSEEDARKITELYSKNKDYWADFMMRFELEMPTPEHENPILTGFSTFTSFIIFGFIPLIPYVLYIEGDKFLVSIVFAFIALILLGILRWKVTTQTLVRSIGEIVLLSGTAGVIAYFVGSLFRA
jgi:VIT1/CCC1 family predicted Fe2+/Mn2+ transporter